MKTLIFTLITLLLGICAANGQQILTGTVTGEEGDTLIGATLVIKETNIGAATDVDGSYLMPVYEGGKTLIVSYVGYETMELDIAGRNRIDIVMKSSAQDLAQVIVTGYSEIESKKLISSVAVVDGKEVENTSFTDPNQMLQGRVPGLFTTASSGQPGAAGVVRIRGTGTLHAGANPLYVVDGIIVQSGDLTALGEDYKEPDACCTSEPDILAQISPADVENITVLKDASATALYGSRGSNGVIVISTKRGKPGKAEVKLNMHTGVTMPNFGNFELMNAEETWNYERKVYELSGYTPEQIDELRPASMLDNTTNWLEEAFVDGRTHNVNLQVRGGSKNTRFFASGGYFYKDGTMISTDFERYSLRANVDQTISDRIDLGLNFNASYTNRNNAYTGNHAESPMLQVYFNTPLQGKTNPETGELYTGLEPDWIGTVRDNFLYSSQKNYFRINQYRLLNKLSLRIKLLDNLIFTQNGNLDAILGDEKQFYHPTTANGPWANGYITNDYNRNIALTNQSKLKYYTNLGLDHSLDILGVFEYQRVHWSGFGAEGINFQSEYTETMSGLGDYYAREHETDYAFLSYLALANYSFKDRYMLTASFRRDGSSRFGDNNRWANFWSLGASWRIKEETLFQKAGWLNDLRLRASYGTSGNANIGNFNAESLILVIGNIYQGETGSGSIQLGNENLQWELSKSLNAGLDFAVLDNRVYGTVEVYRRRTENVFLDSRVSATTGFETIKLNAPVLSNNGVEFSLGLVPVKAKKKGGFSWKLDFNIAFNDSEILKMPNHRVDSFNLGFFREGYPARVLPLATIYLGVDPQTGEPQFLQQDGSITKDAYAADRYITGSPHPDYTAGLNTTISFKGFSLSALFYTAQGQLNDIGVFGYMDSQGRNLGMVHLKDAADFWEKPGDVSLRPTPQVGGVPAFNTTIPFNMFFVDGSFIRLRNVELRYALPNTLLDRAHLRNMQVFIRGENLLTITDYPGMDPEGVEWGRDNWRYPVGKSLVFGTDITF